MKGRRKRLIEGDGVEMFELRIVHWFDTGGTQWTSVEMTTPEGVEDPVEHEILGVLEMAKRTVMSWHDEAR